MSKDALIEAAWRDVAVTDNSLEQAISALRARSASCRRPAVHRDRAAPRLPVRAPTSRASARRETDEALERCWRRTARGSKDAAALETLERERVVAARAHSSACSAPRPTTRRRTSAWPMPACFRFESTRADERPTPRRWRAAVHHAREACRLDPRLGGSVGHARVRARSRRSTRRGACRRAGAPSSLEPDNWRHHLRLAFVGWGEERLRAAQRALQLLPGLRWRTGLRPPSTSRGSRSTRPNTSSRPASRRRTRSRRAAHASAPSGCTGCAGLLHLRAGDETARTGIFQRELAARATPVTSMRPNVAPMSTTRSAPPPGRTAMWPAPLPRSIARCRWRRASRWREPRAPCCRRTASGRRGVCSSRPDSIDSERIA